ncbi:RNA polymerase sigma factor [Streptomyces bobili]|uniref:RNA polymerase sigma factor n=1 Tax=Streptomyces bobili TaxID=67280 RepID=UPI0038007FA1
MGTLTTPVTGELLGAPRRAHALGTSGRLGSMWGLLLRRSAVGRTVSSTGRTSVSYAAGAVGVRDIVDLYHQRRLDMVRLAMLLVDDLPTAEDVVQEAFTALYRRHGVRLDGVNEPAAYLRTSVINAARSVLRRRRTLRAYVPERAGHAAAADERILASENHQQVLAALGCLTRRQREVLVLRYWSDLSEAAIAQTLGLSQGTVKSTSSRALAALRRQLQSRA